MKAVDEAMKWASENPTILERNAPAPLPHRLVLSEVARERERQMDVEGWSLEHDDVHGSGEMAAAAAAYADHAHRRRDAMELGAEYATKAPNPLWPWSHRWWKPKSPRRDLIRAAALIVAEIERLDRAESRLNPTVS